MAREAIFTLSPLLTGLSGMQYCITSSPFFESLISDCFQMAEFFTLSVWQSVQPVTWIWRTFPWTDKHVLSKLAPVIAKLTQHNFSSTKTKAEVSLIHSYPSHPPMTVVSMEIKLNNTLGLLQDYFQTNLIQLRLSGLISILIQPPINLEQSIYFMTKLTLLQEGFRTTKGLLQNYFKTTSRLTINSCKSS